MKKNDHRNKNAERIMKSAGYVNVKGRQTDNLPHPDADEDKALINKMVKPKALKAGYVNGGAPKKRLDKPSRVATPVQLARGGAAKKKKESKTQVNVIVAGKGNQAPAAAPMPPVPPQAAPMPPRPPMAAPAGAMPTQGMPPRPGMKKGGAVKMTAGAGGGLGRLEKAKEYGGKPLKKGGRCK